MFGLGMTELLVIAFILLLLFGKRLPASMKSLGESLWAFRDGMRTDQEKLTP